MFDDWHKPANWIGDPLGYVFLPRAMLDIGKALYPNEWTGAEPPTPVFLLLPLGSAAASEWQKREAHIALCKERPDFGRKPLTLCHTFAYFARAGLQRVRGRSFPRSRMPNGRPPARFIGGERMQLAPLGALRASPQDSDGRLPPRTARFRAAAPCGRCRLSRQSPNGGRLKAAHCIIGLSGSECRAPPRSQTG